MPVIRRSRNEDLHNLHRIWADAVRATHHFLSQEDFDAISVIVLEKYLPCASLWVAIDDQDAPLAFLGADGDKLDSLFVDPALHGQGLGRALIDHAFTASQTVFVDVNEANAQARAFYARLGFAECGRSETDDSGKPYPLIHMVRRSN
ncbi:MAG TPA: acetyltransferase [Bryobacteraceae bacterium]|nr:acetyltransferase [Bryobacteraceae bacterium]HPT26266.1 acetyltransferase [Bryobacteraceae bacterium]